MGLDLFLLAVPVLHQLLCHFDDVIQLTPPARQLGQEVLKREVACRYKILNLKYQNNNTDVRVIHVNTSH